MALERLDIKDRAYFKLAYASQSGIKEAHKMFQASERGEFDPIHAYRLGSAIDAIVTDPNELSLSGMTDKDVSLLTPMRRAFEENQIFKALFKNTESQVVFIDKHFPLEVDGMMVTIPVKCKYDSWNQKFEFGGDLKSTVAKTQAAFTAAAKHFKYQMQGAWYMDITGSNRFVIIAVSKINFKTFVININRGDKLHLEGQRMYKYYAKSWWKLHGSLAT